VARLIPCCPRRWKNPGRWPVLLVWRQYVSDRTPQRRRQCDSTLIQKPWARSIRFCSKSDGTILVGGYLTRLGDLSRTNIGRPLPRRNRGRELNPGANDVVNAWLCKLMGKLLVGVDSSLWLASLGIDRRLNADGTLIQFNPGASAAVNTLALQADGKIVVGGSFTTLGGQLVGGSPGSTQTDPLTSSFNRARTTTSAVCAPNLTASYCGGGFHDFGRTRP